MTDASPEARLWVDGFLRGHEPEPPEDEHLRPTWLNSIKLVHRTGVWEQPE